MLGFDKRPRHGFLSFLLWVVMVGVYGMLLVRMVPLSHATGRAIPEVSSFVPWVGIPAAVCLLLAFLWHRRVLAGVSTLACCLLLAWHIGYFVPSGQLSAEARQATAAGSATASTDDSYLRVMTLNTDNGKASAAEIVATVRAQGVEVLALQEVDASLPSELEAVGISEVLPHHVVGTATVNDNGGVNCLYTLAPLSNVSTQLLDTTMSQIVAGDVAAGGRTLRFVSAHPNSPHRGGQGLWSEGLSTLGDLASYDHTYVVMGDFNATWDHALFRSMLGDTFVDAGEQAGEGFHMTFPANSKVPPLIEIDHIVYQKDAGVFVGNLAALEISGTDHRALLGTLEVQ